MYEYQVIGVTWWSKDEPEWVIATAWNEELAKKFLASVVEDIRKFYVPKCGGEDRVALVCSEMGCQVFADDMLVREYVIRKVRRT